MKNTFSLRFNMLLALAISFLFLYSGGIIGSVTRSSASDSGMAKAVFKVKCYDDGKAALMGLKGVQKVETGYHYIYETDTVFYDPTVITIEEMQAALKKAGTYVGTVSGKERN
jgi:copper chaperone CopZ